MKNVSGGLISTVNKIKERISDLEYRLKETSQTKI